MWLVRRSSIRAGQRLQDPNFLASHFRALRWTGHAAQAADNGVQLTGGGVRVTRYLVYQHVGSRTRTAAYNTALYGVPVDEAALTTDDTNALPDLTRRRYTRREVLDGVYERGGAAEGLAPALVWMRRAHVHEALMQGTVEVSLVDGGTRTFNVHRNNGVAYDRAQRNP